MTLYYNTMLCRDIALPASLFSYQQQVGIRRIVLDHAPRKGGALIKLVHGREKDVVRERFREPRILHGEHEEEMEPEGVHAGSFLVWYTELL